jgi:hypothetical protein
VSVPTAWGRARALIGVEQIDPATLESWLRLYLGPELQWDANYVELDGKAVLVITVEPPRWGDKAYPLRKAFDRYEDGIIFVRRLGKTERASSAEIDQLSARAARGGQTIQVNLSWSSSANIITSVKFQEQDIQAWIKAERARLTPTSMLVGVATTTPGTRPHLPLPTTGRLPTIKITIYGGVLAT